MGYKEKAWDMNDPYINWLKKSRGVGRTTVFHYSTYYRKMKMIGDLNQKSISKFIQDNKNNCVVRAFVNSMIKYLATNDIIIDFEMPPKVTGRKKKKITKDYSKSEIKIMRGACYGKNKYTGVLFDILYDGALRRAEVPQIKINSFDWNDYFANQKKKNIGLKIEGKGKKERVVLIRRSVFDLIISDMLDKKIINMDMDINSILSNLNSLEIYVLNKTRDGWVIWNIIRKISEKCIGRAMRPHEIRHTRATELQDMGVNIRDIQHYLGHSNPQITEIYLHTKPKTSIKHILEKLDG
ncbi:MAG: hypothetical protein DRN27_06525 [Thermoplasmata archaeon]|nr:MAG: hypothetical protein DRN27_06525 [Thermoplasmata archaeon]